MHGKIKAQGSYLLNAKRVSARVQKNQNQQSLFEMMYVSLYTYMVSNIKMQFDTLTSVLLVLFCALGSECGKVSRFSLI